MEVRSLESPAPLGSRFPNLTTTSEGTMIMSWFTPYNDQGGYELKMAEWDGTLWSKPNTITKAMTFSSTGLTSLLFFKLMVIGWLPIGSTCEGEGLTSMMFTFLPLMIEV